MLFNETHRGKKAELITINKLERTQSLCYYAVQKNVNGVLTKHMCPPDYFVCAGIHILDVLFSAANLSYSHIISYENHSQYEAVVKILSLETYPENLVSSSSWLCDLGQASELL
jgi:hypothetical protein